MSNKVISLGNESNNTVVNDNVYQDISMVSKIKLTKAIINRIKTLQTTSIIIQNDDILVADNGDIFKIDTFSDQEFDLSNPYKINKLVDIKSVQNSIDNIFSWTPGERILNPEFGNRLYQYLYEGINQYNEEQIVAEIRNCVSRWEPRVTITNITNVSEVSDTEDNTIILNIEYYINGLNGIIYNKQYQYNRNQ